MNAKIIKSINTGGFTMAVIQGQDAQEVENVVEQYFRDYPKEGYATAVSYRMENDDGTLEVGVRRYSSCD